MSAALSRQVRRLLVRYGRKQVSEALANIEDLELPQRRPAAASRSRPKNPPIRRAQRPRKSPLEVVESAQVDPEVRPVIERIAVAYEAREILPEPWRVKDFLAREGLDPDRVRSRADALPKVVAVLAKKPRERLEHLFGLWRRHAEVGELGVLADVILGPPKTAAPAGER